MSKTGYDFIIVGAGSAGCVLAARLSENPSCQVLLLEAGGSDQSPLIQTPAYFPQLQDSQFDWGDRMLSQPHLLGVGRRVFVPQGRVLGGSSSINYMIYIRGSCNDYDHWATLGNQGWSYQEVLPFFIKSENNLTFKDQYHGTNGPLTVSSHEHLSEASQRYLASAQTAGIPFTEDFNGAQQEGCGTLQRTIANGMRCSAAEAFLKPALNRPNLTVLTHAQATKIIFNHHQAVGVQYLHQGISQIAHTEGEILLAAGAFRSPQLLMLSGVGDGNQLAEYGIKTLHELAGVGKNLQDHVHIRVRCELNKPLTYSGLADAEKQQAIKQYEQNKTGFLASNFLEVGAFVHSPWNQGTPDLQLFLFGNLTPEFPEAGAMNGHGLALTTYLNRPESRGEIKLSSADPLERPRIDPNYFQQEDDLKRLVEGVRWNLKILHGKEFNDIRGTELSPGESVRNQQDLESFVRRNASTTWHPAGTCKMGSDAMSVVDAELKIHGLKGLRVVDASIMPVIVSGNTNAPVMMIAEKAAEMIKF